MTNDSIVERVHAIVNQIAGPGRTPDDAGPDTPLGESGYWLDSVEVLEVLVACEHEFGTVFEAGTDLTPEKLFSARDLAELIRARISA